MNLAPWQAVVVAYAAANLASFCLFAWDKARSRRPGAARVRESTLHLWALASGGAGALAAMLMLRHKTRHAGFWLVAGLAATLHGVGWAWWLMR